ncbi:MAG: TerB family tellurite resistance protein [Gammaproteobacteria bacterium]|nr:TerB family tellurite resistance protein [Gammaproteobacteria bacterium]MDE0260488.1 TerB family tellurite resistance protein [Gammaproteobacteria bacterium]
MSAHPLLAYYLRVAYGCMACDGDIDPSEVSCLRSIAVQMGQPVAEVDATLASIREEFSKDPRGMVEQAWNRLQATGLQHGDALLLLDMLVQLVEADGEIRPNETQFVRDLVHALALDLAKLRQEHPEWRPYLAEVLRPGPDPSWAKALADDFGELPEITLEKPSK